MGSDKIRRRIERMMMDEEESNIGESGKINEFEQWTILGDGCFIPSPKSIKSLNSGLYDVKWSNKISDWCLEKQPFNTDELFELPTPEIEEIINDMKIFWEKRETYKSFGLIHKRGILLYGDPGCGKSGILQICIKHLIEKLNGVVINLKDVDSIKAYVEIIPKFRQIEPERPLVVIIEDIDSVADDDNYSTSVLLNILDGVKQIENVVYMATTNYPERLAERITNRPSRFDRRYYISPPDSNIRKSYLKEKIKGTNIEIDIEKWVKDTENLSISHLKELFISVVVLDNPYDKSLQHICGMKKSPKRKNKNIGFNN